MSTENQIENGGEFEIDTLLAEFHKSVDVCVESAELQHQMVECLHNVNNIYKPFGQIGELDRTGIIVNVVAGIYNPIIHAYASAVLRNIQAGTLSNHVIAPPRDAYPLAVALIAQAKLKGVDLQMYFPHVNRNTAGIANNQKTDYFQRSDLIEKHIDQVILGMNGKKRLTEVETGIYGTTSLVLASELKKRGIEQYIPVKLYGLGPNLSFVHAILSSGNWMAEEAEQSGMVDMKLIKDFMVILDSMEEFGMEKFYRSVETLKENRSGVVSPVKVQLSVEERQIAAATNKVIYQTAYLYNNMSHEEMYSLISKVPKIVALSQDGMPFTLKSAIPPMDSKETYYQAIRNSELFDYPDLVL